MSTSYPFLEKNKLNAIYAGAQTPARVAAGQAIEDMKRSATLAGELLNKARLASMGQSNKVLATGRAAVLAQQAYDMRISAEIAKYRAGYLLASAEHGDKEIMLQRSAAKVADESRLKRPFLERASYHGVVRDYMKQAADAMDGVLRSVPPLPEWLASSSLAARNASRTDKPDYGPGREILAQPMFGWRPKKYNDLIPQFFPADVRAAAGGLSGTPGGGLGIADVPIQSNAPWYTSLLAAVGFGVQAAGQAASQAGQNAASSNPSANEGLKTAGGFMQSLSHLLTGNVNQYGYGYGQYGQPIDGTSVMLIGGTLAIGGFLIWKLLHKH